MDMKKAMPMEKGKAMSERDKEIIIALADNRMNINKAAEARFMHRNTVVYHIDKIKQITGLDPTDFRDLCKLLEIIGEEKKKDSQKAKLIELLYRCGVAGRFAELERIATELIASGVTFDKEKDNEC